SRGRVHLSEDGCDVAENGRVQESLKKFFFFNFLIIYNKMFFNYCLFTADEHHDDDKYLLVVGVGGHVAEADAGEGGHREVEGGDVGGLATCGREIGMVPR